MKRIGIKREVFKALLLLVSVCAVFPSFALADGCFVPEAKMRLPEIPLQRAVVKYRNGIETMIVESTLHGEGGRFGWIIPVPGEPEKLEKSNPELIKALSSQLQPELVHKEFKELAVWLFILGLFFLLLFFKSWKTFIVFVFLAGLLVAMAIPNFITYRGDDGGIIPETGIKVLMGSIVGNYETRVLRAKSGTDLNRWLSENGFRKLPGEGIAAIDDYIEKKWLFVTAKLIRENGKTSTPGPCNLRHRASARLPGKYLRLIFESGQITLWANKGGQVNWREIRNFYPSQWLLTEAIKARSEGGKRILEEISVINAFPDSMSAMKDYKRLKKETPIRELFVFHTSREKLDITERRWIGLRGIQ